MAMSKKTGLKPRNPIVGYLVTHPNRGTKIHKDKKRAARVPTQREVREILNSEGEQ